MKFLASTGSNQWWINRGANWATARDP